MNRRRLVAGFVASAMLASIPAFTTAAPDPQEVVIGSILPLTGASAQTGAGLRAAQQLAVDLINGHESYPLIAVGQNGLPGLHNAKLRIVFADSQGKPDQGKAAAEQLITQDHVVALVGAYQSSVTATASQVAERYGVPFLSPSSSNPTLHLRNFKTFFRTSPHDGTFAENFFEMFADFKKAGKPVGKRIVIVNEDGLFGTGSGDAEEKAANQAGFTVAARIPYAATTTDVAAEVQKVKAANPDIILIASYLPDALLYMKGFKEQNIDAPIVAQDAGFIDPPFLRTLGKDADYVYTRDLFSLNIKRLNKGAPLINELFKGRFNGASLDGNTARDFTGILVLVDALNRAKSTSPQAVIAAMHATDIPGDRTIMPWKGVKFDEHGQNTEGAGIVEQILDEKYQTVWPSTFAVAKPVWPVPAWSKR